MRARQVAELPTTKRDAVRIPGSIQDGGLRRAVLLSSAALLAVLLAAGGPSVRTADAANATTKIVIDGDVKKSTHDRNFTFSRRLSSGCHTVRVVQTSSGSKSKQISRFCSDSRARVVVDVDGFGDVDVTVR